MLIIVDERELVTSGYTCRFGQEGIASSGFCGGQFVNWVDNAVEGDVQAVEAFLIGECPGARNCRGLSGAALRPP